MRSHRTGGCPDFISFSGIDGAGKSTQIQRLCARMQQLGLRFRLVQFWNDVALFTSLRETAAHALFKGDKGVGSPSAPVNRRDKNVRSWLMTCVRLCLCFVDALSARSLIKKASSSGTNVVIFDRYIYDELANLNLQNRLVRAYVRLVMKFVPRPNISFLLDAEPVQARARKPEYPIDFLHTSRAAFLQLSDLIGGITVIAPMPPHRVEQEILRRVLAGLSSAAPQSSGGTGAHSIGIIGESAEFDRPCTRPAASS
jgi:thymidylate kinase